MKDCAENGLDAIPAQNRLELEDNMLKLKFRSKYNQRLSDWWLNLLPTYSLKKDDKEYVVEAGYSSFVGDLVTAGKYEQDLEM